MQANVSIAWGATVIMGFATWSMYRKMIKERREKDERIKKLELRLDPNRTTSGVTPTGLPQKEN